MAFPINNAALVLLIFSFGFFFLMAALSQVLSGHANRGIFLRALSYLGFGLFQMFYALSLSVITSRSFRIVSLLSLLSLQFCFSFVLRLYFSQLEKESTGRNRFFLYENLLFAGLTLLLWGVIFYCEAFYCLFAVVEFTPGFHQLWALQIIRAFGVFIFILFRFCSAGRGANPVPGYRLKMLGIMILSGIIFLAVDAAGFLYSQKTGEMLLLYSLLYFNAVTAYLFIVHSRSQSKARSFLIERPSSRYTNSKISGIDVESVIAALRRLMSEEEVYRDETLTLEKLAHRVDLSAHQLSELLNRELHLNYNSFVNSYRLAAAKKLLIDTPQMTVLNVALGCGFNSKTTFNKAFVIAVGMTPSEYRKQNDSGISDKS